MSGARREQREHGARDGEPTYTRVGRQRKLERHHGRRGYIERRAEHNVIREDRRARETAGEPGRSREAHQSRAGLEMNRGRMQDRDRSKESQERKRGSRNEGRQRRGRSRNR